MIAASPVLACLDITPRQREIVRLRLRGLGRREIAHRLGISPETVRDHLDEARARTGAADEVALLLAISREEWARGAA